MINLLVLLVIILVVNLFLRRELMGMIGFVFIKVRIILCKNDLFICSIYVI